MDLVEHRGKALFAAAGLPVLPGALADDASQALKAAAALGLPVVVKAQVKSGGRGKAGGVRVCTTPAEVETAAGEIMALTIGGQAVEGLLIEKAAAIARELYLAIATSRAARGPLLVFAGRGGVDIETLAHEHPAALVRHALNPLLGPLDYQLRDVLRAAAFAAPTSGVVSDEGAKALDRQLRAVVLALWHLFRERDATLVEINPLVVSEAGELICLDSKVTIDDNALYRQVDLVADRVETEVERRAREAGIAFVALDGDIGVLGNGAGLVMSTLDQIAAAGGRPANFCDIGGGARAEVVKAALELIFAAAPVRAVLLSIFGGITRGDEVARGLLAVLAELPVAVPVIIRLDGNGAEEGRAVLAAAQASGDFAQLTVAPTAAEAVRFAVAAARGGA